MDENMNLLAQLINSMDLASKELEKAIEKRDAERTKKLKGEILNFQKQIAKIIGQIWH